MTALDDRAEIIANFWRDHPEEHTWRVTLKAVGMRDSAKSRAARKRACEIAVMRGDCIAYACYANHDTWQYVKGGTKHHRGDPVTPLVDPMLHASVTASGVKARERTFHDHMNKERMRGLDADDRELVQIQIDFEKNQREAQELHARQTRQLIKMRNQQRG